MERAAGRIIGTGFFERYASIHHINNVNAVQEFLNKAFRNQSNLLLPKMTTLLEPECNSSAKTKKELYAPCNVCLTCSLTALT